MILRALLAFLVLCAPSFAGKVFIVTGPDAPPLEKRAAENVARDLGALFAATTVIQTEPPPAGADAILIGSPRTNPAIPADGWPQLSEQGHVLRHTTRGLIVGGSTPVATLWAASELSYRFGIRPLLHGDAMPIEKPALRFEGIDAVLEPAIRVRAWSAFSEAAHSARSWPIEDHARLIPQLAKMKFTHLVLPASLAPFPAIPVDGDIGGRAAFKGARIFTAPNEEDLLIRIAEFAAGHGLTVIREAPSASTPIALGASAQSALPQFALSRLATDFHALLADKSPGFVATVVMTGDLNASAHFVSRAAFAPALTAEQSLEQLATPICGEGVAERLWKGFQQIEQAAALIAKHDAALGVPGEKMFQRHLELTDAPPAWLTEVKTLYTGAMNEMYRANTRARGGARPFTLHHAKRLEFAVHFCTAIESLRKAAHDPAVREESQEQAIESIYNALNAHADAARDASDRAVIALLNEHGYRPLLKMLEAR